MYDADALHNNAVLEQKLQVIYTLTQGTIGRIDLSLRPDYLSLLEKLGNPHKTLPPVIHVAGTNGKGSVVAMLRAILQAAGYKVHSYTSPHLIRFNERIILAGQEISDTHLEALLDETIARNDSAPLTFFEITTALALTAFARTPADIVLLEVGLGGRLDCTNVIDHPLATIITRISRDHTEFLGETLKEIAAEKAGIMKPGTPCIIAPQTDQAVIAALKEKSKYIKAITKISGEDWLCEPTEPGQMRFTNYPGDPAQTQSLPRPNLAGPHQIDNAGAALATLPYLTGFDIPLSAIKHGLTDIDHPGRLQQITGHTINKALPAGWELWFDGGHNDSAGEALAAQAAAWQAQDGKPLHLILGMMPHKDHRAFLAPLQPHAQTITIIPVPGEAPVNIPGLTTAKNIESALSNLAKCNRIGPERILVTGSFYLAPLLK